MNKQQMIEQLQNLPLKNRFSLYPNVTEYYEISEDLRSALIDLLAEGEEGDPEEQRKIDEWEDMHGM